jgi:hypothetical protein
VEEQGEGQRRVGSGGRGAGAAHGAKRGGAGQLGLEHMAGEGGGAAQRETERGGLDVDEGGPSCNSPKVQGLQYKAEFTFKP